jgi:tyrosinase
MFFSTSSVVFGLLASTVICSPTPAPKTPLEERGNTFAITGITGTGTRPRLEIRQIQKNVDQWNLYLLTLQAWKSQSQSNPLSYYGVAGIHGVPNQAWDGVGANPNAAGAVGYCTHSSILFPSWHRAYLALFEQQFYSVMLNVVQQFPAGKKRQKYAKAASTFRVPYWDWAIAPPAGKPTLPLVLTQSTISVTTPSGQQTISNPLYNYNFAPLDSANFYYAPWNAWQGTLRWPTSEDPSASSQQNLAQSAIENNRLNLRDNVYNLFTQCSQYPEFSNDASGNSDAGCHNSLEAIHDSIHSLVGGQNDGHMTYLWYAAFDPVFWLHHA